jgi:hypothetical protein
MISEQIARFRRADPLDLEGQATHKPGSGGQKLAFRYLMTPIGAQFEAV